MDTLWILEFHPATNSDRSPLLKERGTAQSLSSAAVPMAPLACSVNSRPTYCSTSVVSAGSGPGFPLPVVSSMFQTWAVSPKKPLQSPSVV